MLDPIHQEINDSFNFLIPYNQRKKYYNSFKLRNLHFAKFDVEKHGRRKINSFNLSILCSQGKNIPPNFIHGLLHTFNELN